VLHAIILTATPDAPSPASHSLADREEYGPITGRPGDLFTAAAIPLRDECDELGRRLADWMPGDHLL